MLGFYVGWGKEVLKFLQSALAALIGVQSEAKRAEDFKDDNLGRIILIAFVSAVMFVVVVSIMVSLGLPD